MYLWEILFSISLHDLLLNCMYIENILSSTSFEDLNTNTDLKLWDLALSLVKYLGQIMSLMTYSKVKKTTAIVSTLSMITSRTIWDPSIASSRPPTLTDDKTWNLINIYDREIQNFIHHNIGKEVNHHATGCISKRVPGLISTFAHFNLGRLKVLKINADTFLLFF